MSTSLKTLYTKAFEKILAKYCSDGASPVFVLAGIEPYIDMEPFAGKVADPDTFGREGNSAVFNPAWCRAMQQKLLTASGFQILSHQQYASIQDSQEEGLFDDRIVIVYDNLRTLFPIAPADYVEETNARGDEIRSEQMPCYQAEQLKVGGHCYYVMKRFDDRLTHVPLFAKRKDLASCDSPVCPSAKILDVVSDPYALDVLMNECLAAGSFGIQAYVKVPGKNGLPKSVCRMLQEANHLFSRFGGGISLLREQAVDAGYVPSEESVQLLRTYWGEGACFRDIEIYENPELTNKTVSVSQGLLVDTIIQEYQKGKEGRLPQDVFITAPTGSGKSLIFQLPAFYAAAQGDMTIVVSPLKALMTDQVEKLRSEHDYHRVEFLNSDLSLVAREHIIDHCKQGEVDILYLSPELLLSHGIRYFIGERRLGLLVVDEAHLITTWGRDFRIDYWFLGDYINKMRRLNNCMFPLVALTATAVFGGTNDMVFDSIRSLYMHNPHKFIGHVRRDNIEFVFDTHDEYANGSYDKNKEDETVGIIRGIHDLDMKGIVYAPYTRHINRLKDLCDEQDSKMAVAFHGGMLPDLQKFAYQVFKSNQCKIMIATKAFGMGVDISDIQVVYHHAPSGLLPDYIQEIGRVARKKGIQGVAALTFSKSDLRYSKQLFSISSLKPYQLKEVLNKIVRCYHSCGKKRNMLVDASDFAYIFDAGDEVDQKVATALMMIEKDYLFRTRFNVLTARSRKSYTSVYARTTQTGMERLKALYGSCFKEVPINKGNYHTLELNLEGLWTAHFSDRSFPQLKNEFYKQRFLKESGIDLVPQIKFTLTVGLNSSHVLEELQSVLRAVGETFAQFRCRGAFFSQKEFVERLSQGMNRKYSAEKIGTFVLNTYSGYMRTASVLEGDSFLQQRIHGTSMQYQVFNTSYEAKFAQLVSIFSKLYDGRSRKTVDRYLSINDMPLKNHIRIGSLLEMMNLGTFETTGGDNPKIFLRLNDPRRIEFDAGHDAYSNKILESVKERHKDNCALFEYLFTYQLSNEQRWSLIEDFFLGMSNEDLFEKYPSTTVNHVNILEHLKNNCQVASAEVTEAQTADEHQLELFKPVANQFYYRDNMLTIGNQTMPVKKWLTDDPVALHRTLQEYHISIEKEDLKILLSKLRVNHFAYYRDYIRLKLLIEFPGYSGPVQAAIPYQERPVRFYKWWKKHSDDVTMSYVEKIKLFLAVERESPGTLNKAHKALIGK